MRKKYAGTAKWTPKHDMSVWKYEVKKMVADLKYSSDQLEPIIKAIAKLEVDCVRSADNLDNVIIAIKTQLKSKIKKLGIDVEAKEKEFASIPTCNFWKNLFSGWGCQRSSDKQKKEIRALQAKFRGQIKTFKDVESRMHYFDDLQKLGRTLAAEAGKLLGSAKDLKEAIDRTLKSLQQEYTDEEIEENFGDDDEEWIEAYTEQFLDDCNSLEAFTKKVMADCKQRKSTLDRALIWG